MLAIACRRRGFRPWTAHHLAQAIAAYQAHADELDLVLLDVQIPGTDGPGILTALRELNPKVRCCFMSGESGRYHPQQLLAMGALDVFTKPFELTPLMNSLRSLASQPAMTK
jgi:DNA-binding response OmpR family regulator